MKEIWKDIKGYEGRYQVSSLGRVYSNKSNIIRKPKSNKDGYLEVSLWKNGKSHTFLIHRLVAEHFIPNINNKTCVNHINSKRDDNKVNNLEWVNIQENNIHALKYGNRDYSSNEHMSKMGRKRWENKLKAIEMYDKNYNFIREFKDSKEASEKTGIKRAYITDVCSGQQNSTHGYIFRYK